jgi:UDP-N-acetylmuramyl pentapeptide phosphotransferase/UDP-N-acetylglucosamine-1-phosphate transferase
VSNNNDDIIIEILKYGKSKKPDSEMGFTMKNMYEHLKSKGFRMDHEEETVLNMMISSCFLLNVLSTGQYVMKAEGYFKLLEYQELFEARESSKQANKWALIALSVSIAATIFSVIFSLIQINSSTQIDNVQIEKIIEAIKNQDFTHN